MQDYRFSSICYAAQDWVADLVCGHQQHIRHMPPWRHRP
jgi:hypothetical protein